MIKTLIVDDEPLALEILESYIGQLNELELVAKCNNALEANQYLSSNPVDLMFLDIEMPVLRGTEFVKLLSNPPALVFTTAYPEFAVQGFELNALDYLLKPISFDRFIKAVNKFTSSVATNKQASANSNADFIFVKADKKLVKVNFNEIVYIEGLKDYVIIHTPLTRIVTLQTMKSLEEKLPQDIFIRAHRSFIVNLDQITTIQNSTIEVMTKGQIKEIPIGNNYKDEIESIVEKRKL